MHLIVWRLNDELNGDEWEPRRRGRIWLLVIVAVLIIVPLLASAIFYGLRPMGRAHLPFLGHYPLFFPFGWIFSFLIIFFVLRLIFWPWGWRSRRRNRGHWNEYHILRVRYSRGEITKDQFDQMTRDLQESNQKTQNPS